MVPSVIFLSIDAVQMAHADGQIGIGRFDHEVVVLCEAQDYVKFTPSLLYFGAFINILLHIIPSLLQGCLSIAERQACAMALYS